MTSNKSAVVTVSHISQYRRLQFLLEDTCTLVLETNLKAAYLNKSCTSFTRITGDSYFIGFFARSVKLRYLTAKLVAHAEGITNDGCSIKKFRSVDITISV